MVVIGLSAGAVARIRFAVSCLWEVAASIRVLRDRRINPVHRPWVTRVQAALAAAGPAPWPAGGLRTSAAGGLRTSAAGGLRTSAAGATGGLRTSAAGATGGLRTSAAGGFAGGPLAGSLLWQLIPPAPAYLPDFLTPPPTGLSPDLDAELAVLRATPAGVVRHDLDRYLAGSQPPPAVCELYADPPAGLDRLAGEIAAYWRVALAPDWPRILRLSGADVAYRSRLLVEHGAAALLNDLHRWVCWDDDHLRVDQPYCAGPAKAVDGGGLVVIPSVFVWPAPLTTLDDASSQLAYPVRGIGTLWERSVDAPAALSGVIGRGRAQLLAALGSPLSTTELARRTGMSAAGVSQHLAALRAAGLVVAHRQGRAILNTRTAIAEALLSGG